MAHRGRPCGGATVVTGTDIGDREPVRVGVSACLLGERVRFDGQHKRDRFVTDVLAEHVELVPVCPEIAIGLGVPREPVRLVERGGRVRAVGVRDASRDVTGALRGYGVRMGRALADLAGYVLKARSPSCGPEGVKLYGAGGVPLPRAARGVYAEAFLREQPLLPAEEEGRLHDPGLREAFLERVFVYDRWLRLRRAGLTPAGLVGFHTEHKYLALAHDPAAYRRLGRLAARAGGAPVEALAARYIAALMEALVRPATPRRHVNVLQHLLGFLRGALDAGDRAELVQAIERYRQGRAPLIVPMTLLHHHFRRYPDPFVARQRYLAPYPDALRPGRPG